MKENYCLLNHLGLITIEGQDAKKFLQGQLTCNVEEIIEHEARLGAHCNPQGRIISLFYIFYANQTYFLQMPHVAVDLAINALKKYAVFFKVTMKNASDDFFQIGYSGKQMTSTNSPSAFSLTLPNNRHQIIYKKSEVPPLLENKLISSSQWRYEEIKSGVAFIYPETSEKFLPHEINLPGLNGVSFNKGCYTGQEIIARMHYRGKLKTHLYLMTVKSDQPPMRSHVTYPAGIIVDWVEIGYNHYALLIIAQESEMAGNLFLDPEHKLMLDKQTEK